MDAAAQDGRRDRFDWSSFRGKRVRLEGYASSTKLGPRLESGAGAIDVGIADATLESAWASLAGGALVRVEGTVIEKADLPVCLPFKPGEPVMQCMPVPEGTDLDKARRHDVIEITSVKQLRTTPDVEAALRSQIGKDTELRGIVWSLNGHWWFNHDGVEVHVTGTDAIAGFREKHGRAVMLRGRLDRRPMPRIDQIVLKPNRDLADAFVIDVREMLAHPGWRPEIL